MHTHTTANQSYPPEVERAIRDFQRRWADTVTPVAETVQDAVASGAVNLDALDAIRADIEPQLGSLTADIETLFQEHSRGAATAGRTVAARRNQLDIAFDVIPQSTIEQLNDWATTASQEVSDTLAEQIAQYLRGAHEEGLDVGQIADQFEDEFVDGRLTDWKADQLARDNTVAPANAGNESAIRDSSAVGKQWSTTLDGRQRETHDAADGQIVSADGTFLVGGFEARHPGDPQLPVAEFTQCRCQVTAVFESDLSEPERLALQNGERIFR